jgi:fermentation-respiration switch protein FrsA (DUF1100 family)
MMRSLFLLLLLAVLVYGTFVVLLSFYQNSLLYFPTRSVAVTPSDVGLEFEKLELKTEDGVHLAAWFVPATLPRGTILFCHGNGGNISHRLDSLLLFHRLGFDVLIFDYRGYGDSEGQPSELGTYRDVEACWRYLTQERGVAPGRIILFGRSLGGAVALYLASHETPGALILESTFTSVPDLAAKLYPLFPVRLICRMQYDSLARIGQIRSPVLIIHSREDEIIPFNHGQRLFAEAKDPKSFLELRGGHNDGFLASGQGYILGLNTFLTSFQMVIKESK